MQLEQEGAVRCRSPFCSGFHDGIKGRLFVPEENAHGLALIWCPDCVRVGNEMKFFSTQTATMIRETYQQYRPEDLPAPVRAVLKQFAKEILEALGEEL